MDLLRELENLGLSAKEACLYAAIAQGGKAGAGQLAKKTGLARATVYFLIDSLQTRGLDSVEYKKGKTFFVPQSPRSMLSMLERSRAELDDKISHVQMILPDLAKLFRPTLLPAPRVRSFEGKSAILNFLHQEEDAWHESMLRCGGFWWGYEDPSLYGHYKSWFHHIYKKFEPMRKSDLSVNIFSTTPTRHELKARYPQSVLRPTSDGKEFSSTIWVMGEYVVAILSKQEPHYAFEIKDDLLGSNLRTIFQLLWKTS